MNSEEQTFGARLTQMIRSPGQGARFQNVSGGGSVAGGNTGSAEMMTRATPEKLTQTKWMMGDPFDDPDYFFEEPATE